MSEESKELSQSSKAEQAAAGNGGAAESQETKATSVDNAPGTSELGVSGSGGEAAAKDEKSEPVASEIPVEVAVSVAVVATAQTERPAPPTDSADKPSEESAASAEGEKTESRVDDHAEEEEEEEADVDDHAEEEEEDRQTTEVVAAQPPPPAVPARGRPQQRRGIKTAPAGMVPPANLPASKKQPEKAAEPNPQVQHTLQGSPPPPAAVQPAPPPSQVPQSAPQPAPTAQPVSQAAPSMRQEPEPVHGFADFLQLAAKNAPYQPHELADFATVPVKSLYGSLNAEAKKTANDLPSRLEVAKAALHRLIGVDEANVKLRMVVLFFVYRSHLHGTSDVQKAFADSEGWLTLTLRGLHRAESESAPTIAATATPGTSFAGRKAEPQAAKSGMAQVSAQSGSWDKRPAARPTPPPEPKVIRDPFMPADPINPLPWSKDPFPREDPINPPQETRETRTETKETKVESVSGPPPEGSGRKQFGWVYALLAAILLALLVGAYLIGVSTNAKAKELTCQAMHPMLLKEHLGQSDPQHFHDVCRQTKAPDPSKPFVDCRSKEYYAVPAGGECAWDVRKCDICYYK